jgi:hypothetical protein
MAEISLSRTRRSQEPILSKVYLHWLQKQNYRVSAVNHRYFASNAIANWACCPGTAVLVLANFRRFQNSTEIVQALARQFAAGKP